MELDSNEICGECQDLKGRALQKHLYRTHKSSLTVLVNEC